MPPIIYFGNLFWAIHPNARDLLMKSNPKSKIPPYGPHYEPVLPLSLNLIIEDSLLNLECSSLYIPGKTPPPCWRAGFTNEIKSQLPNLKSQILRRYFIFAAISFATCAEVPSIFSRYHAAKVRTLWRCLSGWVSMSVRFSVASPIANFPAVKVA